MTVFWDVAPFSLVEVYQVSEVSAASIALMEAESTSETSDYTTQHSRRQSS
jgi:hypothetical protein